MVDMNNLCFKQRLDPYLGILQPWYTWGILDIIQEWDISDKTVLEFGGGSSSFWYAAKAKEVFTIDANKDWFMKMTLYKQEKNVTNLNIFLREINEGDQSRVAEYLEMPDGCSPDIIANDGILRTEVCQFAVDYFKAKGGGILICDNWKQSYVWMSPKAEEIMSPFQSQIREQEDHTDNDGVNKWKSAIFWIK